MIISMIYASDLNGLIGLRLPNGEHVMPWGKTLKTDLENFKKYTMGKRVVMGRHTFESLGNKRLSGRVNIVLTSRPPLWWRLKRFFNLVVFDPDYPFKNVVYARDLTEGLEITNKGVTSATDVVLIGGASVYEKYNHLVTEIVRTRVKCYHKEYFNLTNEKIYFKHEIHPEFELVDVKEVNESDDHLTIMYDIETWRCNY